MSETTGHTLPAAEGQQPFAELSHAGAVVDKAIEYMVGQRLAPLTIASALLGGALGLLARTLDDEGIVQVLNRAVASVRAGDLHRAEVADRHSRPRPGH